MAQSVADPPIAVAEIDELRLLTIAEVAQLLRVSRETIRRLEGRGDLVPIRVLPNRPRYRPADIRAYLDRLAARRSTATPEAPDQT